MTPLRHEAKEYLGTTEEQIREGLAADSAADLRLAITWSVTLDEDIASGIIQAAEDGSDVIAMTTHGSYGLPRWVMGSITGRVLHATWLPLLIVRPPDMIDKTHQT
jgi:nucleotide-binding universal stress UspA family protein